MARLNKKTLKETYTHHRGWGWEHWIENLPEYCGKILHVVGGMRGSLHFHVKKMETMLCVHGKIKLRLIDTDTAQEYFVELGVGDSILIPRGQPHQIIAPEMDSEIIEFSTMHEEDDSRRIQKGD